jgi:hypothetical protein
VRLELTSEKSRLADPQEHHGRQNPNLEQDLEPDHRKYLMLAVCQYKKLSE